MEGKKYEIESLEQLQNLVTEENFERLMLDFSSWLKIYSMYVEQTRKEHPEETKGKTNTEISKAVFIWIDDGKHEILEATVTNANT